MRPVLVAAVNERHCLRSVAKLLGPVERRISTADYYDALSAKLFRIVYSIEDPPPVPRLGALLRQPAWREGSDSASDDDRAGGKSIGVRDEHEVIVGPFECRDVLIQVRPEMELRRLLDEGFDEILCQDLREAAD